MGAWAGLSRLPDWQQEGSRDPRAKEGAPLPVSSGSEGPWCDTVPSNTHLSTTHYPSSSSLTGCSE